MNNLVINAFLILNMKEYFIDDFIISFNKPINHIGKPQHTTLGGNFSFRVMQFLDDDIIEWAKNKSTILYDGIIEFRTEEGQRIMNIKFIKGACVSLLTRVNMYSGSETHITVSASQLISGEIEHNTSWNLDKFE